jgi:hypothetical protein
MYIITYMSGKTAATVLGLVGAAAVGIFFKVRKAHKAQSAVVVETESSFRSSDAIDIDDDAAAEIIRRAKPEFERARELYAY